jgi:hypothetical protein
MRCGWNGSVIFRGDFRQTAAALLANSIAANDPAKQQDLSNALRDILLKQQSGLSIYNLPY